MDYSLFERSPAGVLRPTIQGARGFVPNALPPALDLGPLAGNLQRAALALGELKGIGALLPNPMILVAPFQRREAVSSSQIEGTFSTLTDLLMFEEGGEHLKSAGDAQEVLNYVRALEHGLASLATLSLSLRLVRELHQVLMKNLSAGRTVVVDPGAFRRDQNWIGGRTLELARFIPCPVNELPAALDAFEKYLNAPASPLPELVDLALMHYQFETIHPFPDGNGRVGRLLIPLFLLYRQCLTQPLLYMSPFLERHKDEYIDRLYAVSAHGDWLGWIKFFLGGITAQANDTVRRIRKLLDIRTRYLARMAQRRNSIHAMELVDLAFRRLYFSTTTASQALGISFGGARNVIRHFVEEGILTVIPFHPKLYMAQEVWDVINTEEV